MNQKKQKSTKKQLIALAIALCCFGASMAYRQVKIEEQNRISENLDENIPADVLFKDEVKVMNALADEFEKIHAAKSATRVDDHGQAVMDLVSKWRRIKELKKNFTAEEVTAEAKKNKESVQLAITRLKNSSMSIPLYAGGHNLMDQVGKALGALIKKPAKSSAPADPKEPAVPSVPETPKS